MLHAVTNYQTNTPATANENRAFNFFNGDTRFLDFSIIFRAEYVTLFDTIFNFFSFLKNVTAFFY